MMGSLQLVSSHHDLGICTNRFKRLDALSLRLSESVHRPIYSYTSRNNVFKCHSFLIPGQANEIPILKTAVTAVSRSCNMYGGSPLVLRLVPAVSIIAFAIWGLAPFLRHSRNIFLHRNDSSWKKSSTHYVMSSYIQPLLLWTGAALVCRALDPISLPSEASQLVKQRLLNFVRSLSTVLAFAYCLSSLIQQTQKFFMETNDSNDTRNMGFQFAGKAVYTAVWVAAVSLFMELLGFSTQKWLTAGGLGTVLLTLAGREIFTNFLSSAMIHATRPFIVNEWIQTKIEGYDVSGTVEHVGWWSPTIIRGEDREAVHIPNHKFTVNVVRNLSQKTHWRIKTHLAISHLDVSKINSIVADMRKVLAKNPQVEQQRLHRRVFLENINPENQALLSLICCVMSGAMLLPKGLSAEYLIMDHSLRTPGRGLNLTDILISCFVKTSHFEEYLCVKEAILLDLLRVISHHRARLATPIRTVQKVYTDADIDNIPFSETIYSRPRAANNRPFLLIEPSYKINGDDKSKPQARSTRKNEEHDAKATVTPSSSKTDGKAAETSLESKPDNKATDVALNTKADSKIASSSSDSKIDTKSASQPSSDKRANPKVTAKTASGFQGLGLASDGSMKKHKQSEVGSGDEPHKSSKIDGPPLRTSGISPPKEELEMTDSMLLSSCDSSHLESALEKSTTSSSNPSTTKSESVPSAPLHVKQDGEKMLVAPPPASRPAREENIVLGVALEGSKRTLPIEDEMTTSPTSAKEKELAACRNGNGSLSTGKDAKDGQTQQVVKGSEKKER
ncbi:hypothetical protein IFM89_010452 [Coptis chinensis]|uniref:Uncharacterized protein n=2 Tax=Magnoliopsida TaxID=3398 RepID=A0A835I3X0_9MAGN|nr:hypothetical protein IFM89_010452 [Coptis chinensis]